MVMKCLEMVMVGDGDVVLGDVWIWRRRGLVSAMIVGTVVRWWWWLVVMRLRLMSRDWFSLTRDSLTVFQIC
jgi:hypothetical protein